MLNALPSPPPKPVQRTAGRAAAGRGSTKPQPNRAHRSSVATGLTLKHRPTLPREMRKPSAELRQPIITPLPSPPSQGGRLATATVGPCGQRPRRVATRAALQSQPASHPRSGQLTAAGQPGPQPRNRTGQDGTGSWWRLSSIGGYRTAVGRVGAVPA